MRRLAKRAGVALALTLSLSLSGCAGNLTETAVVAGREILMSQIRLWNSMGVDPWQASPEVLFRMESACHAAMAVVTVWNPTVPSLDSAGRALCAVALEAAAKRQPAMPFAGEALPPPVFIYPEG